MINGVNNFYYLPRIFFCYFWIKESTKEKGRSVRIAHYTLTNMSIHLKSSNNPILMYKLKNLDFYI